MYDIEPIHAEQGRIVREIFVDTADDNYITARWCFVEGLNVDYFWLAVHSLEKYMKGVLLLNGRSGKRYRDEVGRWRSFGHDIVVLYEQVKSFAADFLPSSLERPRDLEIDYWRDETPEAFFGRLYRHGNADNRYQIFGFVQHREDLFKLDRMVFALRRLCVPLDAYYLGKQRPGTTNLSHRDVLAKQPDWWTVSSACKLEKTAAGKRGERLRRVLLNLNLLFATVDFPHGGLRSRTSAHNPVLGRSILVPLEQAQDSDAAARAVEVCDWVIENIQLPPDVAAQLSQARAKRKT